MTESHLLRVLVVDDQPLIRMGNALVLDAADDIVVVGEASNGEEAVTLAAQLVPDVVLMDVRMPGMGGIEATKIITRSTPRVRVAVLTTFDLDEYAFGALNAGASAFLLKSTTPEFLTDAVRTVAAGEAVVEPRITRQLIDAYTSRETSSDSSVGQNQALLDDLSPRERDVFLEISSGRSNSEISEQLHLSPATVKTHINRIFAKLQLRDRVHAVILAYDLGVARRP